jgi:PAS domain S-box-containing protein
MSREKQKYNKKSFNLYSNYKNTVDGFIIGLFIPLFAWLVLIIDKSYPISVEGILKMHAENILLYLTETSPIVLAVISNFISKRIGEKRKELQDTISQKDEIINKNAEFAKKIGEGDFAIKIDNISKEDKLGNSLMLMRNNLVNTYKKENELNWIAKGREIIADILRRNNNIEILAYETVVSLITYTDSIQGAFYIFDEDTKKIINIATYAYNRKKFLSKQFDIGQGLIGQAAYEKEYIYRKEIPNDYITISSGILGDKKPKSILITPLIGDEKLQGIIEVASLKDEMPDQMITLFKELSEIIGQTLFNLKVNVKTETLLIESQNLTTKLRKNEDELHKNAQQMQLTQIELEKSNKDLATKIDEVERGQNRLHNLLENASEVITIYDQSGIVQYVSPSVKTILGFEPDEMVGKNRFNRGESILQDAFNELIKNPKSKKRFEYRYENKNKEILWLETTGQNLIDNSAIGGVIFNTRDITVRKVAEKAQRLSGEMQALSENSPDMIIRISPEGKFYYANPMVKNFLGVSANQVKNNNINTIDINKTISTFFKDTLNQVIKTGKKINSETIFPTNKEKRIVQFNAIPEFNKEGELETILFVAHDVTERKKIEIEIEKKNKSITESINYAQRIQTAIIPDNDLIKRFLPKSFIFYEPRDVVSGDFPWFFVNGDNIYIAAVDCTGHGVPGALLSFIGYFILNNIVDHDKDYKAGEILDLLHEQVRKTLKQDSPDANARDGMDIALCKINPKKRELEYSGAHRPMFYVKNNEFQQFKGNPKAVGGIPLKKATEDNFVTHTIKIENSDKIFIFSDGLPDQIGGETGRKYQAKKIMENIMENNNFTMDQYYTLFTQDYLEWRGNFKQIDDILLIGIEF